MNTAGALALFVCTALAAGSCTSAPAATEPPDGWAIEARLVESCCCDPICPCIVGSPPTRGHCQGNRLVEIVEGRFGDVDLDGVDLVLTFDIGKWTRLYFEDEATEEQVEAAVALLERQRSFVSGELLGVERVPLTIERTPTTIAYSVPAAQTEVEVMRGFEDEPIRVLNLRRFRGYTQYRSRLVRHTGPEPGQSFEYAGTNGFAASYSATGAID